MAAALYRSIQAYMRPAGESGQHPLDFFHPQMKKAARKRYMLKDQEVLTNKLLARYFLAQLDPSGDHSWKGRDPRAVSELTYHLIHGKMWKVRPHILCSPVPPASAANRMDLFLTLFFQELEEVLTSIPYLEKKCSLGLSYDLIDDLHLALAAPDLPSPLRASLGDYLSFLQGSSHILKVSPELVFQQAANQPDSSAPAAAAKAFWENQKVSLSLSLSPSNFPPS